MWFWVEWFALEGNESLRISNEIGVQNGQKRWDKSIRTERKSGPAIREKKRNQQKNEYLENNIFHSSNANPSIPDDSFHFPGRFLGYESFDAVDVDELLGGSPTLRPNSQTKIIGTRQHAPFALAGRRVPRSIIPVVDPGPGRVKLE